MNNECIVSKEILETMYIENRMPMHRISSELGIAIGSVYNYCRRYGIPTRSQKETFTSKGMKLTDEQRKAISERTKGRKLSEESKRKMSEARKEGGIGHKKNRHDGYVAIYFPDHPKSTKDGYVMEHDLVMECLIGRHLQKDEVVHHINKIRSDNRKENLKLMTKSEHMSFHARERHQQRRNDLSTK